MPIITIVILVDSRQDKTRQGKGRQDEIYIWKKWLKEQEQAQEQW